MKAKKKKGCFQEHSGVSYVYFLGHGLDHQLQKNEAEH